MDRDKQSKRKTKQNGKKKKEKHVKSELAF